MKVIFAGTPDFAAAALKALVAAGHELVLVLTQPDRPAGRGMSLQASPVKRVALDLGLSVAQPINLKGEESQGLVSAVEADVMVVAAYGLILPQCVLDMPRLGCINIHASLLPRWRGAAPIQRAILAGDQETGVCIMQMEAGLDTGPVLSQGSIPIGAGDTAQTLHDALAALGAELVVAALPLLPGKPVVQPDQGVTYAAKLEKSEARIDWGQSASSIDRQIRAFNPFPGAYCEFGDGSLKIWQAIPEAGLGDPGEVLAADRNGILVACGEGALRLKEVQKAGGKRLAVAQFLAGKGLAVGDRLL